MELFTQEFQSSLQYVVIKQFPNLISQHKTLITKLLINILKITGHCYGFSETPAMSRAYMIKLSQNNYRDVIWMLRMILPYIDEQQKNMSDIISFDQVYHEKMKNVNINREQPRYIYSNIQFDRCVRNKNGEYEEIQFNEKHLMDNYHLFIDSILRSRYKLSVNWVDIVPIIDGRYKELSVYKNTMYLYKTNNIKYLVPSTVHSMLDNFTSDPINNMRLNSIGLDDIYNTISLSLYDQIVPCKWMIFDIVIASDEKYYPFPLIIILHTIIPLTNCLRDINWIDCTKDDKSDFKKKWEAIIEKVKSNKGAAFNSKNRSLIIRPSDQYDIIRPVVMYFDKMYSGITSAVNDPENSYQPLRDNKISEPEDKYDQEDLNNIKKSIMIKSLITITAEHIYEFFKESLQVLKSTWYGSQLIDTINGKMEFIEIDDQRCLYDYSNKPNNDPSNHVTYKNVYNYCKSFVHKSESDDYVRMGKYFSELSPIYIQVIEERLNRTTSSDWFNISGNIRNVYKLSAKESKKGKRINAHIYTTVSKKFIDVVFDQKTKSGIFTQFIDANHFTDNSRYNLQIEKQKEQMINDLSKERMFFKDTPFKNAYYYMTNRPFSELSTYDVVSKKGRTIELNQYNYFKWIVLNKWNIGAAYYWVAQLGFIHHYINNRITFLTAGTGVGKSTEIPKLFCYYLKALDYIPDPIVLITVPRTSIIDKTTRYVAESMGVPTVFYDRIERAEAMTRNFSIQYKYRGSNHRKYGYFPMIIYMTDGSLDVSDPTMKNTQAVAAGNKRSFIYRNRNIYDIILIDEAHEHNYNMDIILTLMRNACLLNNMIKLVIISATIDADEPIYRRYYREIDDNMKYPYNRLLDIEGLDRVNVDRRCHIQIPGQRTQFPIFEEYRPGGKIVETIQEICNSTSGKNILVFQPGQSDIRKLIAVLNRPNTLPDNVLAVPFYSEMPNNKAWAQDIDKYIEKVRINKSEQFEISKLDEGDAYYKSFVMVATNIAEASLTIDLDYVVETGKQKTLVYDYEKRGGKIKEDMINEASRLQRKGRVGRKAPGSVYYLYPENSLVGNVKQYNIAISDIHINVMYEYLKDPDEFPLLTATIEQLIRGIDNQALLQPFDVLECLFWEEYITQFITSRQLNVNIDAAVTKNSIHQISKQIIANKIAENWLDMSKNKLKTIVSRLDYEAKMLIEMVAPYILQHGEKINSVIQMIRKQYFVQNNVMRADAMRANAMRVGREDAKYYAPIYPLYSTGYDASQLTDENGSFYIIHPEELAIRRNIAGMPIESNNPKVTVHNHRIESMKIIAFWDTLLNRTFIELKEYGMGKSLLGKTYLDIMKIVSVQKIDDVLIQIIAWGIILLDEMEIIQLLNIIAFLDVTKNNIRDIFRLDYRKRPLDSHLKMFADPKSDILTILNIVRTCDDLLKAENISTDYREYIRETDESSYDEYVRYILPSTANDNYLAARMSELKQISERHAGYIQRYPHIEAIVGRFDIDIDKYAQVILTRNILLCDYIEYKFTLQKDNNDGKKIIPNNLEAVKKMIRPLYEYIHHNLDMSPIDAVFLWSCPYSVYKKIPQSPGQYVSLFNPYGDSIYALMSTNPFQQNASSMINVVNMGDYLYSIGEDQNTNSLNILCRVTEKDLLLLSHIYNPKEMALKYFKIDTSISVAEQKIIEYQNNERSIEKGFEKKKIYDPISLSERVHSLLMIGTIVRSTYNILVALSYNSTIWKILATIHPAYSKYARKIADRKIE